MFGPTGKPKVSGLSETIIKNQRETSEKVFDQYCLEKHFGHLFSQIKEKERHPFTKKELFKIRIMLTRKFLSTDKTEILFLK